MTGPPGVACTVVATTSWATAARSGVGAGGSAAAGGAVTSAAAAAIVARTLEHIGPAAYEQHRRVPGRHGRGSGTR